MKSVKMLSEELKVSKQTIFNNIKRLNIESIKQENTSFIKDETDIERIIQRVNENKKKYGFESNTVDIKNNESDNVESENDTQIIEILKHQIDTLNRQIEKQESRHETTLEFYRKELQERSKLLENQQILALESNKKIQKLENQLEEERHLNYPFDTSNNDRKNVDAQETTDTTDSLNINQDQETEMQYEDISVRQSDESTQDDVAPKKDNLSNSNDNDSDIEEKSEETQPKKGFWNRLFGS
ncbi:DUF536 domain-containing protein [Staphylococcus aureus]|uniref:DUF536 domain-containing protein n=1 Tax=Staphylococcus aureus TaxID=1280 RepID=UPI0018EAA3CD|nr:DUF536 domain-containing protein [Staphylococcus aureus]MBJ6275874.1 DUF536 domain-containing protein [Staphylococcus aureus]MBJ6281180.1 DUF536 domain-containing protein [Staphylococcus aureus]MBJ6283858.1 DUF536 domain-containing protein [Staphylococcus aureus]MBJ6286578.1 DUF536 domain-containing protein [Staphylococcus aureus]MBJ6289251.1 DUF536 domain-containing protein [Staphylococcus aureus]